MKIRTTTAFFVAGLVAVALNGARAATPHAASHTSTTRPSHVRTSDARFTQITTTGKFQSEFMSPDGYAKFLLTSAPGGKTNLTEIDVPDLQVLSTTTLTGKVVQESFTPDDLRLLLVTTTPASRGQPIATTLTAIGVGDGAPVSSITFNADFIQASFAPGTSQYYLYLKSGNHVSIHRFDFTVRVVTQRAGQRAGAASSGWSVKKALNPPVGKLLQTYYADGNLMVITQTVTVKQQVPMNTITTIDATSLANIGQVTVPGAFELGQVSTSGQNLLVVSTDHGTKLTRIDAASGAIQGSVRKVLGGFISFSLAANGFAYVLITAVGDHTTPETNVLLLSPYDGAVVVGQETIQGAFVSKIFSAHNNQIVITTKTATHTNESIIDMNDE